MPGNGSAAAPRAVLRVVKTLAHVADSQNGCTLSLLSRAVGVPKSSLSNLLRGLVEGDYLVHQDGHFSLGAESYRFAAAVTQAGRLPEISRSVIRRLSERTGETAVVSKLTPDDRMVYVDQVTPANTILTQFEVGVPRPLHITAGGRVILAHFPRERAKVYIDNAKIVKMTPFTETRRSKLQNMLGQIRERGFAFARDEFIVGLSGIAAPIRGSTGLAIGSVILAGPSERLRANLETWSALVCDAGRELSHSPG